MRERIAASSKPAASTCFGRGVDDDAVTMWKALFDRRADVMQIATAELQKNSVIPAEAFWEKAGADAANFQVGTFRAEIQQLMAPPAPATALPPAPVTGGVTTVTEVTEEAEVHMAAEEPPPPPKNCAYFAHAVLEDALQDMVNAMSQKEFETVLSKIEDAQHKYVTFEVKPSEQAARAVVANHPRLQSARVNTAAKLLVQIDGKNCVRHYGADKVKTPYKAVSPRNPADIEAALTALYGPSDLAGDERRKVSVVEDLGCNWVTQVFDARRGTHHTLNKTLLRKFVKGYGKTCPVMELKLCYHNNEFVMQKEQAIQHQLVYRNFGGGNDQHRTKGWGIASLPEPVESIAYVANYVPDPVTLKHCGSGSSLTRALCNVPLRAGFCGDELVKERQLWVSVETARAATANQLAAEPVGEDADDDAVPQKNSQDDTVKTDGDATDDDEIQQPVVVPLYPWAVSEKVQQEFLNIHQVTHALAWNAGQGELAIACIRNKVHFLGFAVNDVAVAVAREHVTSVMLEEHVRNVNAGFLFGRALRTNRSLGGDNADTGKPTATPIQGNTTVGDATGSATKRETRNERGWQER